MKTRNWIIVENSVQLIHSSSLTVYLFLVQREQSHYTEPTEKIIRQTQGYKNQVLSSSR